MIFFYIYIYLYVYIYTHLSPNTKKKQMTLHSLPIQTFVLTCSFLALDPPQTMKNNPGHFDRLAEMSMRVWEMWFMDKTLCHSSVGPNVLF